MSGMVRWEYYELRIKEWENEEGEGVLDKLGSEGWELVCDSGGDRPGIFIFKRPYKLCPACIKNSARRMKKVLLGTACEKCGTLAE